MEAKRLGKASALVLALGSLMSATETTKPNVYCQKNYVQAEVLPDKYGVKESAVYLVIGAGMLGIPYFCSCFYDRKNRRK